MSKYRRKLELTGDSSLENLAHRQINSMLSDNGHKYELFHRPHAGYSIVVSSTLSYDYLAEAAHEARENARETGMSHEMIDAIKVLRRKDTNYIEASDIWMVERIVRDACKKQRRSNGSAPS